MKFQTDEQERTVNAMVRDLTERGVQFPLNGFAPFGKYMGKCSTCGAGHANDKYGWNCLPCAIATSIPKPKPTPKCVELPWSSNRSKSYLKDGEVVHHG